MAYSLLPVLGIDATGKAYFQDADDLLGTYNFGKLTHHVGLDISPYKKWGNTPDDRMRWR